MAGFPFFVFEGWIFVFVFLEMSNIISTSHTLGALVSQGIFYLSGKCLVKIKK